jgi:hypothetical protein
MKATLEFDLTDIDGRMDHMRCVKSTDMALVLWEIDMRLRDNCQAILEQRKYDKHGALDVIMCEIRELFAKHKIDLEELIR